uniref:MIF4G domain-containing protein n=1 Tax=Arcella intermedia TaxID=1963864 RepID=A0A6B2KWV6_9EUKA
MLRKKEEEKNMAIEIQKRKDFLRMRNENLGAEAARPNSSYFKTLDSSVKKNSAFIRKLAKITAESEPALCREFKTLNLNRYIQEVVKELSSAPLKIGDIPAAISICSLFHRYYTDFISELVPALKKVFQPEKNEPISRKRSTLRFLTELFTYGLYNDYTLVLGIVENVVDEFKDDNQTISLILSFVRHARRDLLGIQKKSKISLSGARTENKEEGEEALDVVVEGDQILVDDAGQAKFNTAIKTFFKKASSYLVKLHMKLREKERENKEIENTKGELSEEIAQAYRKQREDYDKVLSNMTQLADQLQCDLPELPEEDKTTRLVVTVGNDLFKNANVTKESPLWDDEGMRSFYEDLEDLSLRVLPALLGLSGKNAEEAKKEEEEKEKKEEEEEKKEGEKEKAILNDDDDKDADEPKEVTQQDRLGDLLQRLETCINRDKIDQAAIDFCYVNSKGNRKKLVNFLFGVSRNKLEILPYYSRLVATLNRYLKDVGPLLVQKLEQEFEQLYSEKHQLKIESKIKNIKFLSELVKFKVCPSSVIFKCLKMCLDDFVHHNVDVTCALLETCGRFLYKTPETSTRTQNLLERMIRLKGSKNFDNKQETLIENAYYSCKPPERPALIQKERTMIQRYIRKLVYEDLTEKNLHGIMKKFRMMDWTVNEADIIHIILKVHKCKYSSIPALASMVSGLSRYHEEFAIKLVDGLLEDIRIGLEKNEYTYNQKLIISIKFLGELYNYSLIEHPLIFDTLYSILGLTHHDELLSYETATADSPNDLFKIRLVCTLLDTCGEFFTRGSTKERLDRFLVYFQKFILRQLYISRDVGFMVDDTFESLRPKMKRYKTHEESCKAVEALEKKPAWGPRSYRIHLPHSINASQPTSMADENESNEYDDEEEVLEEGDKEKESNQHSESDIEGDNSDEPEDDDTVEIKPKASEYMACPEDDEFTKQYEQMLSEDREQRKTDTAPRPLMNMSIPMNLIRQTKAPSSTSPPPPPQEGNEEVAFKVLLKAKGKQKAIDLPIPQDSKLASQHLKIKSKQAQYQEEMKRFVLQYDENERKKEELVKKKPRVEAEIPVGVTPYLQTDRGQKNMHYKSPKRPGYYSPSGNQDSTGIDEYIAETSPKKPKPVAPVTGNPSVPSGSGRGNPQGNMGGAPSNQRPYPTTQNPSANSMGRGNVKRKL